MAAVEDLGTRGASGVLEVSGNPSGAIYLDGGHITFARASGVPGLTARVRGTSPAWDSRADLALPDADDASVAAFAVQCGYLTVARLHDIIRSIIIDSFLVLAIPLAADSAVAALRFVSTRTYWTGLFPRLDIQSVRGDAIVRARRLADYGLSPTTVVALCDLRLPTASLTREQWAVARKIIQHASASDIALRDGTGLTETTECLGSLIRSGLCVPVRAGARRQQASRHQGTAPQASLPALSAPVGAAYRTEQPPTPEILRQVLNGLRKLN